MTSSLQLKQLNKLIQFTIFFSILIFNSVLAATAIDIWEKKENKKGQINQDNEIKIKSPIVFDDVNKTTVKVNEQKIGNSDNAVIGIFDPEKNNFSLNMWSNSDGEYIKSILKRINKLKLFISGSNIPITV